MWENFFCPLIFCFIVAGTIVTAMIVKHREVRAARSWLQTTGTIVASRVQSRRKSAQELAYDESDTAIETGPLVEYDYTVDGKSLRGNRINLGDKTSDYELESILDRYPVGAKVTVFYNPADPHEAVLERDLPASMYWIGSGCALFAIVAPIVGILIYTYAVDWLSAFVKAAPGVVCLGGMATATLLLAIGLTAVAAKASRWPKTRGRIVTADVEAYRTWRKERRRRTFFRPVIVYAYEVNGREYLGDRVVLALALTSTIPWLAGRTAAKYPVGAEVDVYYNPRKPSESLLHPWSAWYILPYLLAAGLFVLAWALADAK